MGLPHCPAAGVLHLGIDAHDAGVVIDIEALVGDEQVVHAAGGRP